MCGGGSRRAEKAARKARKQAERDARKAREQASRDTAKLIAQRERERKAMEAQAREAQLTAEANRRSDQLRMQTYSNYQTAGVQNASSPSRRPKKKSLASSRIRLNSALNIGQGGSTTNLG